MWEGISVGGRQVLLRSALQLERMPLSDDMSNEMQGGRLVRSDNSWETGR